jgi:hypothetical protein
MPGSDQRRAEADDNRTGREGQVRQVTDGTASFGTRRILVPETGADGQEQNGQQRAAEARPMDPIAIFSVRVFHRTRAAISQPPETVNASTDATGSEALS